MKRIALISNDTDMCKILNHILPLDYESSAESFLKNNDTDFDVIVIDINKMNESYLETLLNLTGKKIIIKIISSVPFKYLPQNYRSMLCNFTKNYFVKPFNLYSFKEEVLV